MVAGRRLNPNPSGPHGAAAAPGTEGMAALRALPEVFRYTRHALDLVWSTSRKLTVALALLTLLAGVLPAGIAYVGALIVDAVVAAMNAAFGIDHHRPGVAVRHHRIFRQGFVREGVKLLPELMWHRHTGRQQVFEDAVRHVTVTGYLHDSCLVVPEGHLRRSAITAGKAFKTAR